MYKDCPHVASRRSANHIQLIVSLLSDGNDDEDEGYLGACVANSAVARAVCPWYIGCNILHGHHLLLTPLAITNDYTALHG